MSKTLIVVPMKEPRESKSRLADALSDSARARLAGLLFRRTLTFLKPIGRCTGSVLAVVTASASTARIARDGGFAVIDEPAVGSSLSAAVRRAADWAGAEGYGRLCIIPADLAAPDSSDIFQLLESDADVTVCPSADCGTNALLVSPPGVMRFRYGPLSAIRHLEQARMQGLNAVLLPLESLSFDIDTSTCLTRAMRSVPELSALEVG